MSQSDPLTVVFEVYVLMAGLATLPLVRPPFMRWYRSGWWFISGRNPVDILLKQVFFRLLFEAFVFAIACAVGALGGWIVALLRDGARRAK